MRIQHILQIKTLKIQFIISNKPKNLFRASIFTCSITERKLWKLLIKTES